MENYITHEAFIRFYNKDQLIFDRLFDKTKLLNTLINKIQKESANYKKFGYTEEQGRDKMIGDLFEIFAEMFFKINGTDSRIGVYNYKCVDSDKDYGVDGYGIGWLDSGFELCFKSEYDIKLTDESKYEIVDDVAAKEKIDAGASLVQIYTGFIYNGPTLVKAIVNNI